MLTKMFLFESCFINADNGGPFETLQSATFGPLGITDSRLLIRSVVRVSKWISQARLCNNRR